MQSLTLVMEDSLFQAANTYAIERGLTLTQLLKTYLTHLTQVSATTSDPLEQFSQGHLSRFETMTLLNVDYSTLLTLLGQRGLSLPTLPSEQLEQMADMFVQIIKEASTIQSSPFAVAGIKTQATTEDILQALRDSRKSC